MGLPLLLLLLSSAYARDPDDALTHHRRAPEERRWVGKPITLKTVDADLVDILRLIAEASGFNLVLGDGVTGKLKALDWEDVPWDQALDMIIRTKHLHAEREGNVLRITTQDEFLRESRR